MLLSVIWIEETLLPYAHNDWGQEHPQYLWYHLFFETC